MSDSRLEKFIYAICSMDVSDLPVPLSRIEKLWNCLITGETPDFEPLSRNEKYLMAMLDRYDISNLPAPMSRGEKLLYKIAVGETDLSDVPGYLSRYEELLKYLIENGGISGGDFEYVLYTLNQSLYTLYTTAEKPVKSAILKGNSEVVVGKNKCNMEKIESGWIDGTNGMASSDGGAYIPVEVSGTITISNYIHTDIRYVYEYDANGKYLGRTQVTTDIVTLVLTQNTTLIKIGFYKGTLSTVKSLQLQVEQGEIATEYEPYNPTLVSVKMPVLTTTGKNLFNINNDDIDFSNEWYISNKTIISSNNISFTINYQGWGGGFIYENDGTEKVISLDVSYSDTETEQSIRVVADGVQLLRKRIDNGRITDIKIPKDTKIIKVQAIGRNNIDNNVVFSNIQIEEGSTATPYEPYKTNILTVNEDVTLCGIGDVKDEIDLLTGELTQRIGEVVLDGSETWREWSTTETSYGFALWNTLKDFKPRTVPICNALLSYNFNNFSSKDKGVALYTTNTSSYSIFIRLPKTECTGLEDFKTKLQTNPITVQYELATESIKTVDLTVVDQDNQPTELGTFENVTHVSLEAEGLIPEVEMEVATNLLEDTVFNLTDAFNTLYPTAEKQVKSAILSGNTKLVSSNGQEFDSYFTINDKLVKGKGIDDYYGGVVESSSDFATIDLLPLPKPPFIITGNSSWKKIVYYDKDKQFIESRRSLDGDIVVDENPSNAKYCRLGYNNTEIDASFKLLKSDGSELDYPNLELISVKMPVLTTTGKNLFNYFDLVAGTIIWDTSNNVNIFEDGWYRESADGVGFRLRKCIKVKPNTKYYANFPHDMHVMQYKANGDLIKGKYPTISTGYITTSSETHYINLYPFGGIIEWNEVRRQEYQNCYISESEAMSSYEPFKSNILTVNEDVKLRGIGDVQDTLDLMTGELTQRIGEVVLDGSEETIYKHQTTDTETLRFFISCFGYDINVNTNVPFLTNSNLPNGQVYDIDEEGIFSSWGGLYIRISKTRLMENSVKGLKNYLQSNPITVQYQLAKNAIKTVDLTVVNQDGNETKLGTFDDTTHVLLESEGLIPTASLTVRTKIPSASSTSLLMDDILTKQEQLNTTVDEQSENADATMIATTEIFEETL